MDRKLSVVTGTTENAVALFVSGRADPRSFCRDLAKMERPEAEQAMQSLPVPLQAAVVAAGIGSGIDASELWLIRAEDVPAVVFIDATMFEALTSILSIARLIGPDSEERLCQLKYEVTGPDGKTKVVPIRIDPNQTFILANSVISHPNEEWRAGAIAELGLEFFTLIFVAHKEEQLNISDDDWQEFFWAIPRELYDAVVVLADQSSYDQLEADLIDRHIAAMRQVFASATQKMTEVKGKADELIADLDMGD